MTTLSRVIAIDPSINETGWAYEGPDGEVSGVIRSRGDRTGLKLLDISDKLEAVLKEAKNVDEAVVEVAEGFTYGRSRNRRTGKPLNIESLMKLNKAIGVILLVLEEWGIKIVEIGATQWKAGLNKKLGKIITRKTNHNEADALMLLRWRLARSKGVAAVNHKDDVVHIDEDIFKEIEGTR